MDWFKELTNWRKIGISLSGVVLVFSALLLFLPDSIMQTTGVLDLRNGNRTELGIILFVSLSIFVAGLLEKIANAGTSLYRAWKLERSLKKTLLELDKDEIAILRQFINEDKTSVSAPFSDGVMSSLAAKRIVYRASTLSNYDTNFDFNLQPWARRILKRDKYLLN